MIVMLKTILYIYPAANSLMTTAYIGTSLSVTMNLIGNVFDKGGFKEVIERKNISKKLWLNQSSTINNTKPFERNINLYSLFSSP